jgi:hypothetical protein
LSERLDREEEIIGQRTVMQKRRKTRICGRKNVYIVYKKRRRWGAEILLLIDAKN